jgi:hypothetical protein
MPFENIIIIGFITPLPQALKPSCVTHSSLSLKARTHGAVVIGHLKHSDLVYA